MKVAPRTIVCFLTLIISSGCVYKGYSTFGGSRKLLESDANAMVKINSTPLVMLPEKVRSPGVVT